MVGAGLWTAVRDTLPSRPRPTACGPVCWFVSPRPGVSVCLLRSQAVLSEAWQAVAG